MQVEQDIRNHQGIWVWGAQAKEGAIGSVSGEDRATRTTYAARGNDSRIASSRAKTLIESDGEGIHAVTKRPKAAFPSVIDSRGAAPVQFECDNIGSGEICRRHCGQQTAKIPMPHGGAELSNRKRRIQRSASIVRGMKDVQTPGRRRIDIRSPTNGAVRGGSMWVPETGNADH